MGSNPTDNSPTATVSAPTISRGRRCENCRHFNNGPLAIQHYKAKRHQELDQQAQRIFAAGPPKNLKRHPSRAAVNTVLTGGRNQAVNNLGDIQERLQALGLNYSKGDEFMRLGLMGICLVSAVDGDFVHKDGFCGTKYDARVKVDGDDQADETGNEARDRLGIMED